ncbi:hypothetical protein MANI_024880 [Metarhizium anisopliae]|nr:hypothetical protein MANI_024880 [Metarhizium anisopliae]
MTVNWPTRPKLLRPFTGPVTIKFGDETAETVHTGAILDTGTSLITLPGDYAEMINTMMGAQKSWTGQYAVDCDKVARLPDITFKLDGTDFSLPLSDYIVEVQGTCMSVIAALDVPEPIGPVVTLGDVLLRSYYSIFDLGKGRVGLAMRTSDLTSVLGGI